jgi:3-phosphoshikimate 1-carboxyvinyltransferase
MSDTHRVRTANKPILGTVKPPGSKSETIRALTVAALANGRSHIYGALRAEDTAAMIGVLRAFGIVVNDESEPWTVDGTGGHLMTPDSPLDVAESGLTARIAIALATLAEGETVIDGRGRLRERPISPLIQAIGEQGVRITANEDQLPVTVGGQGGLWGGQMTIDCSQSSQFATALLLIAPMTTERATIRVEGLEGSAGYLAVTAQVMIAFGAEVNPTFIGFEVAKGGYVATDYVVEPDASAGVYPMVAAAITGGRVVLPGLSMSSEQPDILVTSRLEQMGCRITEEANVIVVDAVDVALSAIDTNMAAAPDGALALVVACLFADGESRIRGLGSLRFKESDRLSALSEELSRLGSSISLEEDSLVVRPSPLVGAKVDPHGDHRIAMSVALVGLCVEGVSIANPDVVNKTWPGYWKMLDTLVDEI